MPTSVSCRAAEAVARGRAARGFTLLELLIVLALIGLMTALVAPRLGRTYEAIAGSGEREEVYRQLERLPRMARESGRRIEVAEGDAAGLAGWLSLPEGWTATPLAPLQVQANGVCREGRVRLDGRGTTEVVMLNAPACGVGTADAP